MSISSTTAANGKTSSSSAKPAAVAMIGNVEHIPDESAPAQYIKKQLEKKREHNAEHQQQHTDKPAYLWSTISDDLATQLEKDCENALHGFHHNGRSQEALASYALGVLKKDVTILCFSQPQYDTTNVRMSIAMGMLSEWCKVVYKFSQNVDLPDGKLICIKDKINPEKIYLPCCNAIKKIPLNRIKDHYLKCVQERVIGGACAFCSTEEKDVKDQIDHCNLDTHLNSVYLVLAYTKEGLSMVDVRTVDKFITNRPAANMFLIGEAGKQTREALVRFLRIHYATKAVENTPFYHTFTKIKRMAINARRTTFTMSCLDCDTGYSAFSSFYLGPLLGGKPTKCMCGVGEAHAIPIAQIDKLFADVAELLNKKNKVTDNDLYAYFSGVKITGPTASLKMGFNVQDMIAGKIQNLTTIVGSKSAITTPNGSRTMSFDFAKPASPATIAPITTGTSYGHAFASQLTARMPPTFSTTRAKSRSPSRSHRLSRSRDGSKSPEDKRHTRRSKSRATSKSPEGNRRELPVWAHAVNASDALRSIGRHYSRERTPTTEHASSTAQPFYPGTMAGQRQPHTDSAQPTMDTLPDMIIEKDRDKIKLISQLGAKLFSERDHPADDDSNSNKVKKVS